MSTELFSGIQIALLMVVIIINFFNRIADKNALAIVKLDKDQREIKDNYIKKFQDINENINKKHIEVIEKISKLEIIVAKQGERQSK